MTNLMHHDPDIAPIVHMEERSELINDVFAARNQDSQSHNADKVRAEVALIIEGARKKVAQKTDKPHSEN